MTKNPKKKSPSAEEPTGTYKYDRELGRMVKVSDRVPGLKKKASPSRETGPCGRPRSACGGGGCAS